MGDFTQSFRCKTTRMVHEGLGALRSGLVVTLVEWALFCLLLILIPPSSWALFFDKWQDVAIVVLIVEFLLLKSWLMAVRTTRLTRLGASLISANLVLAFIYQFSLAYVFWPSLAFHHWIDIVLRVVLVSFIVWGVFELLLTGKLDTKKNGRKNGKSH